MEVDDHRCIRRISDGRLVVICKRSLALVNAQTDWLVTPCIQRSRVCVYKSAILLSYISFSKHNYTWITVPDFSE